MSVSGLNIRYPTVNLIGAALPPRNTQTADAVENVYEVEQTNLYEVERTDWYELEETQLQHLPNTTGSERQRVKIQDLQA